jgi:hypothetical protein
MNRKPKTKGHEMTTTVESKLTKHQSKTYGPKLYTEHGSQFQIMAEVRYDDQCGNGHNTFAITAKIDEKRGNQWRDYSGGCCHDEVVKHFPKLAPYIKWHLCSSDGPMHYVANTIYHAGNRDHNGRTKGKERDLAAARACAIWPDATDEQLCSEPEELKRLLIERLPALLAEFKTAVESLGFTY